MSHIFISSNFCPILKVAPKYLFSEAFSEKMFQIKVAWVEGGHKRVSLIWPWR